MNVLIADDDQMTRTLLRRVLTRDCGCTVSEAADGFAALSSCGSAPPDLVVTDLRMPVMDGIELIEAMRQVPALAGIPVVMMTAAREQEPVHRAIELGVTDYLLKPLRAERVAERLRHVVERVTRAAEAPADDDRTPLLVADGSAEFRQAVAAAFGPVRDVHQAQSGVAALQRATETRPGVILVGGELGLLGADLLIRKLRAIGELAGTRIVAVVAKADARVPEHADALLLRTTNIDDLRARLQGVAGSKASGVLAAHPSLRAQIAAAAEQVFGAMLHLDVQHSYEVEPRPVARMVIASITLQVADAAEALTMTLRTDLPSATVVAANLKRQGEAPPATDDAAVAAAVAEVLGIVAGRVKTGLESAGRTISLPPATGRLAPAGDLSEGAGGRMQVTLHSVDRATQFVLQLTAAPTAAPAAPGAAVPAAPATT